MKIIKSPLVVTLLALLVIGAGTLGFYSLSAENIYKELEHVTYTEVLDDEKPTIYYYYQSTCHYCESIKGEITRLKNAIPEDSEFSIKLVDMKDGRNSNAWYDWNTHEQKFGSDTPASDNPDYISDPAKMNTIDDIKVTGTPTMIYVKDNKVVDYQVGKPVFELLNNAVLEQNIDIDLDESVYGK